MCSSDGPWLYIGPVPEIPFDQRKVLVVTVRNKHNNCVLRGIMDGKGYIALLTNAGYLHSVVSMNDWEEVK